MSQISARSLGLSSFRIQIVAALLLAQGSACEPEKERYATVGGHRDRNPATDPDPEPTCPPFNSSYLEDYNACEAPEDCEVIAVRTRCTSIRAYGVASADVDGFLECAPTADGCGAGKVTGRAQDGRNFADVDALTDVRAHCVDGACVARVESRTCGSSEKVCTAAELCVSWLNAMGAVDYACAPNPCLGEVLDCSCAAPICDRKDGQLRSCQVESIEEADVYCKIERR